MQDPFVVLTLQFSLLAVAAGVAVFYLYVIGGFIAWGIVKLVQSSLKLASSHFQRQISVTAQSVQSNVKGKVLKGGLNP